MTRAVTLLLSAALMSLLGGCGYSLAARNSAIPGNQSVAVKMFANRTYQPNMEGVLRLALVSELAARGQTVGDDFSDYVISGEISSLATETAAFTAADKVTWNRIVVEIQLQLTERKSSRVIWKGAETLRQEYPATVDLALQRNSREAAVTAVCQKAAQVLVARMHQSF